MSFDVQVALVPEGTHIDASDMTRVASALSKQVQRDFRPIWDVYATVDAFLNLEDVPIDYWPIVVLKDVQGAQGFHQDAHGQPFAVVEFSDHLSWSIDASHECLEMLADPSGGRLRSGNLPEQAIRLGFEPKRVRYLVEVCDPCESGHFAYSVNGILVSDFYTPQFFDPVQTPAGRYSFTGAIDAPRKVLDGGYLSWEDPVSRHLFQLRMFSDKFSASIPHVLDLNKTVFRKLKGTQSLRATIDRVTQPPVYREGLGKTDLAAAKVVIETSVEAQKARADDIRQHVSGLVSKRARPARSHKRKGR